ncbi:MAG: hypothetical protein HY561_07510, partial [Gemmatimonadetes bacterium]|nr:hypothetical protein [Gemmatimonadota bacterium]
MLITWVDLLFAALGLLGIAAGFFWRSGQPGPAEPPAGSLPELGLTGLALGAAAVGPNIVVVALTPGMPSMPPLTRAVLIPSLIVLTAVAVVAWLLGLPRLTNRLWAGIWIGAVATASLDVIRLT